MPLVYTLTLHAERHRSMAAPMPTLRIQVDIPNLPEELNRRHGFTIFSTVELRTATNTAAPTGARRDVSDLEITPSPSKQLPRLTCQTGPAPQRRSPLQSRPPPSCSMPRSLPNVMIIYSSQLRTRLT